VVDVWDLNEHVSCIWHYRYYLGLRTSVKGILDVFVFQLRKCVVQIWKVIPDMDVNREDNREVSQMVLEVVDDRLVLIRNWLITGVLRYCCGVVELPK
jgi:hypothetical protein